ncbi:hypothetical protein B0H14DRAFT_2977579 [Mycena olivaceomarginata]|nr:hypothetical protein B0H14DRAFT_3029984 [Mycena olivaceomarginata]KAJ7756528.1 hypothetical protein B0H14DRAFT_2977579 [Mycena olivaceomarginata]
MRLTSHKKGTLSTFEPGDLVLGKIRGHTAWPGIVVDPDVLRKSSIGGVRRGKYYAVVFFPAHDHAWLSPNNISKVDREWLEKAMNNPATQRTAILAGYKEALDYALSNTQNGSTRTMKKTGSAESSSATSKSELPGEDGHAFQVRKWRYDLQRTFLGNLVPKSEDIAKADAKLNAIEGFSAMSLDYLVFSKLPKVLRHIHRLSASQVPGDEQYNFRHRAGALVEKWLNQFQSCI